MKFSRQYRLLNPSEFKSVFQRPMRSTDDYFRVLARNNRIPNHRRGYGGVQKETVHMRVGRNRIQTCGESKVFVNRWLHKHRIARWILSF